MAKIKTASVLSGTSGRPITYEVGETQALREQITSSKAGKAISPTPQQKKPIPAVSRPRGAGKRSF